MPIAVAARSASWASAALDEGDQSAALDLGLSGCELGQQMDEDVVDGQAARGQQRSGVPPSTEAAHPTGHEWNDGQRHQLCLRCEP